VACLQREVSARQSHGGEGRIRAARFPARESLEEFDFDHARGLKRDLGAFNARVRNCTSLVRSRFDAAVVVLRALMRRTPCRLHRGRFPGGVVVGQGPLLHGDHCFGVADRSQRSHAGAAQDGSAPLGGGLEVILGAYSPPSMTAVSPVSRVS
jgi:hypothetical protein